MYPEPHLVFMSGGKADGGGRVTLQERGSFSHVLTNSLVHTHSSQLLSLTKDSPGSKGQGILQKRSLVKLTVFTIEL